MRYVGPSTRAVPEFRSPRAGSTLSKTRRPQPMAEKRLRHPGRWGNLCGGRSGRNLDWQRAVPVGWGRARKVGEINKVWGTWGGKLGVSGNNSRHRRKETEKDAGGIRRKQKRDDGSFFTEWSLGESELAPQA